MESCKEASTPMPSSCYMDVDSAGKSAFSLSLNSLNSVLIFVYWYKQPIVSAKQPIIFLVLCF